MLRRLSLIRMRSIDRMFWGISITAAIFLGLLCSVYITSTYRHYIDEAIDGQSSVYTDIPLGTLVCSLVVKLPVAVHTTRKATVAVPCIFKCPAILLCCGRRRQAVQLVTIISCTLGDLGCFTTGAVSGVDHCACHFCCTVCNHH